MNELLTTRRNQCYHEHVRRRVVRTRQHQLTLVVTAFLLLIISTVQVVVDAGKSKKDGGSKGGKGTKDKKGKSGKKYYYYEEHEEEGTLTVMSNNIFRPVAPSTPVSAPASSSDVVYCDELYGNDRQRQLKKGSKEKGKKNKKYSDEVYLHDLGCIFRPDYGKGGSKGKGKGKGGGGSKKKDGGSKTKGGKGKGGGWESSKGGNIPDGLFRAPSQQPVAEPTAVPSSNIIEASDTIDTCTTVNGTIGTVTGKSVDPFIATFTYKLETVPAATAQTVTNLIVPALEQAFGDYLVPYVLDESVLEECSTITQLQKKWEWIAKIIRQQGGNTNRSKLEIQQTAEAQWEKQYNKSKYEDDGQDVVIVQRRSGSVAPTTTVVGMSGAPADKIDTDLQCSTKSQPGNPCFVMLGEITVYLQRTDNNPVNNSRGLLPDSNGNRLLQQNNNVTTDDNYQDAIRAAIKVFMNNTANYAKVSPLIVQLSYVEPEPEPEPSPSSRGVDDSSSSEDGVNKALIGGLVGGLGGCLVLLVGIGAVLKYKQKRQSEQVSLVQQNAETSSGIIDEEDIINRNNSTTKSEYVAPDPLAPPTKSTPVAV